MKHLRLAVLAGGKSPEFEVSLRSGEVVIQTLARSCFRIKPVVVLRDGRFAVRRGYLRPAEAAAFRFAGHLRRSGSGFQPALRPGQALGLLEADRVQAAFPAMHGPYGEDGTIQGFLEAAGIPYAGTGVAESALAMDKAWCKILM